MLNTVLMIGWALVSTPIWFLIELLKSIFYLTTVCLYLLISRCIPFVLTEVFPFLWYYIGYPIFSVVFSIINHTVNIGGFILNVVFYLPIPSGIGKIVLVFVIVYLLIKASHVLIIRRAFNPILATLHLYFSPLLIPFLIAFSAIEFIYTVLSGGKKQTQEEETIPEFQTQVQPAEQPMERARKRKISVARQDDNLCIICFANPKCMLIRPCNHACLCIDCAKLLTTETVLRECPLCRGNILSLERIYI